MKFEEHLITLPENTPSAATARIPAVSKNKKYENCEQLIVKILPAHPYQYLLHSELKSLLVPDVITSIKKKYHIKRISFIISQTKGKEYKPLISQTDCDVIYSKPHYPFALKSVMKVNGNYQLIDWFDFIVLAKTAVGKHIKKFPVSVTLFGTKEHRWIADGPVTVVEIAGQAGIDPDEYIFADHPFAGEVLSIDTEIDDLCAHELLIFPKEKNRKNSRRSSLIRDFVSKFVPSEQKIGEIFEVTDLYANNPCQKCLKCVSICPENLSPFMLSAISDRGSLKEAMELQVDRCSDCGLCSSVCPSRIPLMHNIQKLKKEL
jgi:ferredoxin